MVIGFKELVIFNGEVNIIYSIQIISMIQEQQQTTAVDWIIEQMLRNGANNTVDPFVLLDLKYEAKRMYFNALTDEFKRGLELGHDICKKVWVGDKQGCQVK